MSWPFALWLVGINEWETKIWNDTVVFKDKEQYKKLNARVFIRIHIGFCISVYRTGSVYIENRWAGDFLGATGIATTGIDFVKAYFSGDITNTMLNTNPIYVASHKTWKILKREKSWRPKALPDQSIKFWPACFIPCRSYEEVEEVREFVVAHMLAKSKKIFQELNRVIRLNLED